MKNLIKLVSGKNGKFIYKNSEIAINAEKLGGQAEWAKNQLKDKTQTSLDMLGDLTKLKVFSKQDVECLLATQEAQKNWTQKNGGTPQNSARYVLALQAGLKMLGKNPGEIDAMFGGSTKKALIEFQKENGLAPDGIPGQATICQILESLQEIKPEKKERKKGKKEKNEKKASKNDVFNMIDEKFDFNGTKLMSDEKKSRQKFAEKVFDICQAAGVSLPSQEELSKFLESVSDDESNIDYGNSFWEKKEKDNKDDKKIEEAFKKFYIEGTEPENPAKNEKVKKIDKKKSLKADIDKVINENTEKKELTSEEKKSQKEFKNKISKEIVSSSIAIPLSLQWIALIAPLAIKFNGGINFQKDKKEDNLEIEETVSKGKEKEKKELVTKIDKIVEETAEKTELNQKEKEAQDNFKEKIVEEISTSSASMPIGNALSNVISFLSDKFSGGTEFKKDDPADNLEIEKKIQESQEENFAEKDLDKKEKIEKEEVYNEKIYKANWENAKEFKNKNSEKFMQALLNNKEKLQKELSIPDDLYKDLMALAFADLQLEGSGGKNKGHVLFEKSFDWTGLNDSRGWTQIKFKDQGTETQKLLKKFGIDSDNNLWDPEKSAIATMILKNQQYKWDRAIYKKTNPNLTDLEIMEYLHYSPSQLSNKNATPEKSERIKIIKKYFKIGKEISNFPEKTFLNPRKIIWDNYEGKNNFKENNSHYDSKGCASFVIKENMELLPNGEKYYPANLAAWKMPHEIIFTKGFEIDSLFDEIQLNENLSTKEEIIPYIKNITSKRNIEVNKVKVGDVVNIFLPSSESTEDAYKESIQYQKSGKTTIPTTHVGQITEKNGKLYVTHNVHGIIRSNPIEDFISGEKTEKNNKSMKIVSVYRMNTKETKNHLSYESSYKKPEKSPLEEA